MTKTYTVLRSDRAANNSIKPGDTVYAYKGYDYGISRDDSNATGIQHTSVTLDPQGEVPFFTIPVMDLQPQ